MTLEEEKVLFYRRINPKVGDFVFDALFECGILLSSDIVLMLSSNKVKRVIGVHGV